MPKVIVRIKGGLGNQLFCYAAARRLAWVNQAELIIDDVTGFARDYKFRRHYMLDSFNIQARKATSQERLEPFERQRRGVAKFFSHRRPFAQRRYLEQEGLDFDGRILSLPVKGTIYLDGYWQSENYFKDVEQTIRDDLRIVAPNDTLNQGVADAIRNSQAVALHVRWFEAQGNTTNHNVPAGYYQRAIAFIDKKIDSPRYFVFSDNPEAASARFSLPESRLTYITHNRGEETAYADMWLMTQCQYFITANSTFSWWGAWLADFKSKIVIAPNIKISGPGSWGFDGLIPNGWVLI